ERIRRPVNEHDGDADLREVRGPELAKTSGWMQRIRQQEQAGDERWLIRGEHARLAAAVGLPAEEDAADTEGPHRRDCGSEPRTIQRRGRPRRWSCTPRLPKGKVAAQDRHPRLGEGDREIDEEPRVGVTAGAMREHEAVG